MPDTYLSLFVLIAITILATTMGIMVYSRKQAHRASYFDNSVLLLIILLIMAILSVGTFIAFIFQGSIVN